MIDLESADKNVHEIPIAKYKLLQKRKLRLMKKRKTMFSMRRWQHLAACLKKKGAKRTRNLETHKVYRDEHDDDTHSITSGDTASEHKVFPISQKIDPLMVSINDIWVEMQIDTGAVVSLNNHTIFDRHRQGHD